MNVTHYEVNRKNIERPAHYVEGRKYEPKDVIRDWDLNFNLGNVIKYVSRAGRKDSKIVDLEKAKQYLQFEIDYLQSTTTGGATVHEQH